MSNVRAKFVCERCEKTTDASNNIVVQVGMRPVYNDSEENKRWSKWTPSGQVQLTITNPDAEHWFERGKEYYVDFTPAN